MLNGKGLQKKELKCYVYDIALDYESLLMMNIELCKALSIFVDLR